MWISLSCTCSCKCYRDTVCTCPIFQSRCFCSYILISFEELLCPFLSSECLRKTELHPQQSFFILHFFWSLTPPPFKKNIRLVFRQKFLLQLLFLIHSSFPFKSKSKEKVGLVVRILCSLYALSCESKRLCSLGTKASCTIQY